MEFEHVLPADIEKTSMGIIEKELNEKGIDVPEERKAVVKRVIHTTADFDYAENLRFTDGAVEHAVRAFLAGGVTIVTDTNMALSGISAPSLRKLGCEKVCYMADPEIAKAAKENGTTRAVASMEKAADAFEQVVFAIGNAPTALIKVADMIEAGLEPAAVIGVPVGFVNVCESKEYALEICEKHGIPGIFAMGRKGGSNVAATICNALLYTAAGTIDPDKRWK